MLVKLHGSAHDNRAKSLTRQMGKVNLHNSGHLILNHVIIIPVKPEETARLRIEQKLMELGWTIQDHNDFARHAALGVAVREFQTDSGPVDYALFVNGRAIGIIEAKRAEDDPRSIDDQSSRYIEGFPVDVVQWQTPLPFVYESNGSKTCFRDLRDPAPRQRYIFTFHRPEALLELLHENPTFRARLKTLPPLDPEGLRDCQVDAIKGLEKSLSESRPRSLIQAATGSGKTFTAITATYRLIKYAQAKRILFLVDRNNLGEQAEKEFKGYVPKGENKKFTELYTTTLLQSTSIDPLNHVTLTTIQRLYSILRNEAYDDHNEQSAFESDDDSPPVPVSYNDKLPPDYFDLIIIDECHRSIYNKWRSVLEYFDAFLVGLTATPHAGTYGFFEQNVVSEYTHDNAVSDGVNVPYRVYRIKTRITEGGSVVDASGFTQYRHIHRKTREERWKRPERSAYSAKELDRSVVTPDQIRTVIREFKQKVLTDMFEGRKDVPKTLIFAKDDAHADTIRAIVLEEFDRSSDFCAKITYRADNPEKALSNFRNMYNPRIAVTVDMIAAGTDIRPLEVVLFMRDIKSLGYYEQMKGRGVRTIDPNELKTIVGDDAKAKDYFVLVDAVGVTDEPLKESGSTEREPSITLEQLLNRVRDGKLTVSTLSTLGTRLIRLSKRLSERQLNHIETLAGKPLNDLAHDLLAASDPDRLMQAAQSEHQTQEPTTQQLKCTFLNLADAASRPIAASADLRKALLERPDDEIVVDHTSKDAVIYSGIDTEKANALRQTFREFLRENQDKVTALQILYSQPVAAKALTLATIQELHDALRVAKLSTPVLWSTIAQLEPERVRRKTPVNQLTDLVSLVRFELGKRETLLSFEDEVQYKFEQWLERKEAEGITFSTEQRTWLNLIAEHIATSLAMTLDSFKHTRFSRKGNIYKAAQLFGGKEKLVLVVDELNKELMA